MDAVIRRACILALAAFMPLIAFAQPDRQAAEVRIKAAFLYRFTGFVEWPPKSFARPDSPLIVGVLGADALALELEQVVAGRDIHGRAMVVRRLRRGEPLAGLHVLFVGHAESARLPEILGAARGLAVLTVTESEDALAHGSIINFVVDDKVRFDVALSQAERGNLKISSRLLSVARKVVTS
jgi:YfiR/HmsC-like